MQKILYIPLDTTLNNTVECEKLIKRGDTLKLQIKVFTNGVLADLTGQSIDLILKKADNTLIEYTINSSDIANGVVTATPSQQSTLAAGMVSGELQIYTDGTLANSNAFTFVVDTSLADDVIEVSKNDIQILSELKALIADGQVKINTYEENILAIGNTVEAVEALANVKLYIDTNLPALQNANAQATVNIANETTANNTASQNISDLDTRNNTASSNISDLDTKNSIASTNISDLDSKNTTATQNISDLDNRNNTASSNISSLDSKNSTASANVSSLDAENDRAEVNIAALESFGDATALTKNVTMLKAKELEDTGYGVISGLTVTAQLTPDMTVNAIAGVVHFSNGDRFAPIENNALPITAADTTNSRIDIIYVDSTGVTSYLIGTPSASPTAPTTPTGGFLLYEINVVANTTSITDSDIVDKRKIKNTTDLLATELSDMANDISDVATNYTTQVPYAGTTSGSANTYTISTPIITVLTVGMAVSLKFNVDSTGASTLNWCGLGAKGIKKSNGTDVTNLKATGIYTLRYDGTNFILQGEGGSGNALASDLRSDKTASTDAGDIIGTLDLSLLIPENIRNGVIIDGKTGNVTIESLGGKQYASGTFTATGSSYSWTLAFSPRIIYFGQDNSVWSIWFTGRSATTTYNTGGTTSLSCSVSGTTVTRATGSGVTYNWWAWE